MSNNLEVALAIKIAQTGLENIQVVIDGLKQAGVETSDFERDAERLNTTLLDVQRSLDTAPMEEVTAAIADSVAGTRELSTAVDDAVKQLDQQQQALQAATAAANAEAAATEKTATAADSAAAGSKQRTAALEQQQQALQNATTAANAEAAATEKTATAADSAAAGSKQRTAALDQQQQALQAATTAANAEAAATEKTATAADSAAAAAKTLHGTLGGVSGQANTASDSANKLNQQLDATAQLAADRDLLGLKQHLDIQKEIDATRAAYQRLKESGKLTSVELAQAALKTEDRIRELQHQTNGWSDSLEKAKLSLAGLLASGAGLVTVASQAIEFESAMADVKKVVNGTDEQMTALSLRIRELSTELPISADGLAQIAAAGGQLGVPIEKLETFIQLSAKMATAFNLTAEEAGQAVAKLSNVFNLPIEQVEALGDAINVLGNTTAAREADILDVLVRVGGTASQFGLTAQQTSALAAAFVSMGISSEVAGTGINAILSKLQTANIQGPEFQRALEQMGISAKQLAADIQANPQQALTNFLKTLEQLDGQAKAEILSKLFGAEYQDDVARLLSGLNQYEAALGRVGDAGQTAGAMSKEFATRMATTKEQIQLLKNGIEDIAINLGSVFLPALREGVVLFGDAAAAVAAFVEQNPAIAAVATTLATVTLSVGALNTAFLAAQVIGTKAFASITAGIQTANISMTALAAQVGVVAAAMKVAAGVAGAAWIGWDIGRQLSQEFETVQIAGIALAEGLTELAARAEATWSVVTNPGDYENVLADLDARLQQINDTYAEMYDQVGKTADHTKVKLTEAEIEANQLRDAINKIYNELPQQEKAAIDSTQALAAAWQALGLDASEAMGRITDAAGVAVTAVGTIQSELGAAGATAVEQALAIEAAWSAAIPTAKTMADIDLMRAEFAKAANSGTLTADAVARINTQLAEQSLKLQQALPGLQSLDDAWATLGRTSQAALAQQAADAKAAFDLIKESAVSYADLGEAFVAYAEKAIAANRGVADTSIQVQAELYGVTDQIAALDAAAASAADRVLVLDDSMSDVADSSDNLAARAGSATSDLTAMASKLGDYFSVLRSQVAELSASAAAEFDRKLGIDSSGAAGELTDLQQAADDAKAALGGLFLDSARGYDATGFTQYVNKVRAANAEVLIAYSQQKTAVDNYVERLQSGNNVTESFIATARRALTTSNLLGSEDLSTLRSAISTATAQLQQMSSSATDTLTSLRQELYSLRGETEALQESQYKQRKAELEAALAEAQAAGNNEAINAYKEALSTLAEIRKEQKAQAKEAAATANTSAASSSAKSTATTQSVETVTITLGSRSVEVLASDKADLLAMIEEAATRSR